MLLTQDAPAKALLQESGHASLVVIGSRPGALSGLLLDSVSRAVLEAATCPVLVVQRGEAADTIDTAEDAGAVDVREDAEDGEAGAVAAGGRGPARVGS